MISSSHDWPQHPLTPNIHVGRVPFAVSWLVVIWPDVILMLSLWILRTTLFGNYLHFIGMFAISWLCIRCDLPRDYSWCYHRKFFPLHAGAICNVLFQLQPSYDVICPNESLLLECRVKDKFGGHARTVWQAGANCTLVLPHVLVRRNRTDECGMFEARLRSPPTRNCYVSILTTETPEHGTVIACQGPTESNMVDNYTVSVAGMWRIDLQATDCS